MSGTDKGGRESNDTLGKVIEWKHNKLPRPMEILSIETKLYDGGDIALQLEKCLKLKRLRDVADGDYRDANEELAQIQLAEGLDGLRHNNIVFRCREVQGRKTYPYAKIVKALHLEGMSAETIARVMDFAETIGDNYFVKEIGTE